MNARQQLESYLDQFRQRLKRLVIARGAALLAVTALILTLAAVWFGTRRAFDAEFMMAARLVLLVAIIGIVVGLFVIPLRAMKRSRAVPDIERRAPDFDGRIETYEDLASSGRKSPFLGLLAEDALRFARKMPVAFGVTRLELSVPAVVGGVAVLTLLGAAIVGPGNWRYGVRDLWAGWLLDDTLPPQFIAVEPGDGTVRRGGDMRISAEAQGFDPASMTLFARFGPGGDWQSAPMSEIEDTFEFTFFAVREPVTYYLTAAGVRTQEYSIDVVNLPEISRIRLTYDYPDWTRLDNATEDPGYDIRAVVGTEVQLEVESSEPLTTPTLVIDGAPVAMTSAGNLSRGSLTVEDDGEYFVSMLFNGEQVQVSDQFFITVVDDEEPELSIVRPGRDWRASPIEEVTIAVEGNDDFGFESAEVRYSINGSDWSSIPLEFDGAELRDDGLIYLEELRQPLLARASQTRFDPGATLTIDDLRALREEIDGDDEAEEVVEPLPTERGLEPGDLISYYAIVEDRETTVQTDLYFIEVQPFDRRFSQADAGGGGGGGGGGQQQRDEISQRQKEILTATWNLIREQDDEPESFLDEQQLQDNALMLAELQRTLAEQAQSLAERTQARRLDNADPRIGQFVDNMELAIELMGPAAESLAEVELEAAVSPAQQALQYILRAEALFTDIEVSMQQGGGGGGGGGLAGRDLAELFELEMDLDRNQYETEQSVTFDSEGEQGGQEIDEAIQKLQELARRQEQLAEQANRRNQVTDQERWEQRSLQRETEELLRELEQLQQQLAQAQQQQGQQGQQG
ncbi:MAG TPA: O-antigen ligase family protein, partial [Gammaproteobacteria bacterium]